MPVLEKAERSRERLEMSSKVQSGDLNGSEGEGGGRLYTHFCIQDGKLHLQKQGAQKLCTCLVFFKTYFTELIIK